MALKSMLGGVHAYYRKKIPSKQNFIFHKIAGATIKQGYKIMLRQ